MNDFVHLHLHSEYSLLDGACRIAEIPKAASALGQKAVAITDHGVMYGAVAFYDACRENGIKPIIGCEVYVARRSRFEKSGNDAGADHLILLVKNETGYRNLIFMVSKAFTEGFYRKPRIDYELLSEHSEGLIALSACLAGYIPRHILNADLEAAEEYAVKLDRLFGRGNFYLELQEHGIDGQRMVNECLAGISERTGIPLVATNDIHYLRKEDAKTQAVMMCIQTNTMISDGRPAAFATDEFYLKSADEMERLFGRYENACENTVKIAGMCDFDFTFGKTQLPRFDPPDGMSAKDYLKKLAYEGLERREKNGDIVYDGKFSREDYRYRIEYELLVVSTMGYAGYYLIVADFVGYAKSHGIETGPGRGSGAGSLLAYLTGITEVDPVRFELLFESFLNPQRISMPDFDIDFCYRRRGEVIDYVAERYGSDHVAQIVTFGTMASRAVLRDVGRVMGMSYSDVDAAVRALPEGKYGVTLKEALDDSGFRALYDSDNRYRDLIDTAISLEGMPRNASTHAAGVVITDRPVADYVPLSVNGDTVVTQFDMDTVAKLGLLKFDFLALRYLTIISDTVSEIRKSEPEFDIAHIPLDDAETYALIASGRTDGLFQLESEGMKQLLVSMKPENIGDIMTAIALYRPGPMDAIPKFLANRADRNGIKYCFDCLAPILDETCGCIVYQEQVMQIFREVAGYTYGRADVVRRAIAKKKPGVIEKERASFLDGAGSKGYDRDDADRLYNEMTDFANYAFKKSHAAAYAVISFRTAYLKAHFAPMYYAALITSVFGNAPKMSEYIAECGKLGIRTLPPDINESGNGFTVSSGAIRYGLSAIKNVGDQFIARVVAERGKRRFSSFIDFVSRMSGTDLNRRQLESLIKAGTFDSLGEYRSRLLSSLNEILDRFASEKRGNMTGQVGMFGTEDITFTYPDIPELPVMQKLMFEKESAGIYFSGHILDGYREHLSSLKTDRIRDIVSSFSGEPTGKRYSENQNVAVAGIITKTAKKTTKNGDTMAFALFEDRDAEIELIFFPNVYSACSKFVAQEAVLAVSATVSMRDGEPKLIVRGISPLNPDGTGGSVSVKPLRRDEQPPAAEVRSEMPRNSAGGAGLVVPQRPAPTTYEKKPAATVVTPDLSGKGPAERRMYIKVPDMKGDSFRRALAVVEIFCGMTPVIFFDSSTGKYMKSGLCIGATPFVTVELEEILGDGSVVLR